MPNQTIGGSKGKGLIVDKPLVVENFIKEKDVKTFIDFINKNLNSFFKNEYEEVYSKRFGPDNHFLDSTNLDHADVEIIDLIKKYSEDFTNRCKVNFNHNKLMPAQFWLVKRFPGNPQKLHTDTDGSINSHLKYSGIIYLNTLEKSGALMFPNIFYNYFPKQGDLVVFESDNRKFDHMVNVNIEDRYVLALWATDDERYKLY